MKKIAIITGATGGLGKEFVAALMEKGHMETSLDEIWVIARNTEKLAKLRETYGDSVITICADLSDSKEINRIAGMLEQEKPEIRYLINNAGTGKMGHYCEFTVPEIEDMISINCKTVALLCTIAIPYMKKGSNILNISSQASFQPNPYLNLYAATKAFVTSYSRGLNCELQEKGNSCDCRMPRMGQYRIVRSRMEWQDHPISRNRGTRASCKKSPQRCSTGQRHFGIQYLRKEHATVFQAYAPQVWNGTLEKEHRKI